MHGTSRSFLVPDRDQIRHQIRGILDSYTHDWDVLAELAQNAIDSIRRADPVRGHVRVSIDAFQRKIIFEDNGTGIDPSLLERLLRPFGTDKFGSANQVGQKGVGLTLILFSTADFEIETHHANGSAVARISGARAWVDTASDDDLLIAVRSIDAEPTGLKITAKIPDLDHPLWALTFKQLIFALRTKTALGDTSFIWGEALNADVSLSHTDLSGNVSAKEFDCKYLLPIEDLKSEDSISLTAYDAWRLEADRSDQDKRRKLINKIVYQNGKSYKAGRDLKFWACFVPSRAVWDKLSIIRGLTEDDEDDGASVSGDMFTGYYLGGGLYTSSKGMPTGIYLDLKPRGSAGYVPNFFILIEDPSLSFDIGRKAIQTRQQGMLREIAYGQFREFINDIVKYISGAIDDPDPRYDREELFEEIKNLPDLESNESIFIKRPNGQEATVAGMFFEQLGKGRFGSFKPYISGYRGRYDLYGKIGNQSHVVEFKFDLAGLFRDFSDERKMFDEIDAVVLWDVTEQDRKLISTRGLTLTQIESSALTTVTSRFPGAHYRLNIDGVKSIEIVCMKKFLKPVE